MPDALPPFLIYLLGAAIVPLLRGRVRQGFALLVPLAAILNYFLLSRGVFWETQLLDFQLILGRIDNWSLVFLNIFTLLSLAGMVYILRDNDPLELSAGLLYAGSAMGVVTAGDLISMFFFWEMLTLGAVMCILARRTPEAGAAAYRYTLVHVLGGIILLAGLLIHIAEGGNTAFEKIELEGTGAILMFIGFGINCAWPVLGAWLTDTYPHASVGGLIFMAAYTTKTAVYVLARTFPGEPSLLWIGGIMATVPLLYALIETDLRRVLAWCLINQVGFMVVGIGLATASSLNGTAAHAYSHILYKSLLFMAVGSVIYRTGRSKTTELGGLCRSMPWTAALCCIGALSISAPLFCGFISKGMIVGTAAKEGYPVLWLALQLGSAGVFLAAGLKVPFFAFFARDAGIRCKEAPLNQLIAMGIIAVASIFVGIFPNAFLYPMLPHPETVYQPYTLAHVTDQLALLLFAGLAFALLIRSGLYPAEIGATNLGADWIYRKGGRVGFKVANRGLNGLQQYAARQISGGILPALQKYFENAPERIATRFMTRLWQYRKLPPEELAARQQQLVWDIRNASLPIGITACVSVILLAILIVL